MVRSPFCEKVGLKKGPWTPEEDEKLLAYIKEHGHGSWRALPAKAGLQRCGKSCRLRWTNYLRPDIKRGKFSLQEEQTIIQLHALLGNRWSAIATHLPKRTDNEIKNHWNTYLKKRLDKMGIDPVTHKPKVDTFGSGHFKDAANLSHMAQWERARLEAEARLVREAKLISNPLQSQLRTTPSSLSQLTLKATAPQARPRCLDVLKAWHGMVAGMFSAATTGDLLESPTTPFNFSDNALAIPAIAPHKNSTSTLELPTTITNAPCKRHLGLAEELITTGNDWKCLANLSQMPQMKETLSDGSYSSMAMQEVAASSGFSSENAWLLEPENNNKNEDVAVATPITGNIVGGISDILGYNSDDRNPSMAAVESVANNGSSCNGNLEENRIYWNNLLDLVEAASPFGSHIF